MEDLVGLFLVLLVAYFLFIKPSEGFDPNLKQSECSQKAINDGMLYNIFGFKPFTR